MDASPSVTAHIIVSLPGHSENMSRDSSTRGETVVTLLPLPSRMYVSGRVRSIVDVSIDSSMAKILRVEMVIVAVLNNRRQMT